MIDFYVKRHDRLPEIVAILKDSTPQVVNLSGATVRFNMVNLSDGTVKVSAPATVVNAVTGQAKYAWAVGDTDTAGTFSAEFEVTMGDGRTLTFPNNRSLRVSITDDLG